MADTTTPKPFSAALPGSTSEEAIDLVQEACEVTEGGEDKKIAASTPSEKVTLGSDLGEGAVGDDSQRVAENGAGVAGTANPSQAYESHLAQPQVQGGATQEVEGVTPDSPSASGAGSNSASAGCDLPRTPTDTSPPGSLAELPEVPPGLEPPSSVTLVQPSTTTTREGDAVLPLETGLPIPSSLSSPNAFSSISLSHDDHETAQESLQQPQLHAEFPQSQQQPQSPRKRFEPLPPSQLLSATISHALALTPPSQPRFSFQSHPKGQQNGPYFNFTYKPSSRDVISGIAPHVFDERKRRRSMRGKRTSGKWSHRHSGAYDGTGCGGGYGGRPRASPLRRSVAISWDERSIYLEEASHAGTITSRVSIDIVTGHERKDLSDSSSSSSASSGDSSPPPSPMEKGTSKKLLANAGGKAGTRWRKFKLFKNFMSKMKKRDSPAQTAAAH